MLHSTWSDLKIDASETENRALIERLVSACVTAPELARVLAALRDSWQLHWRRPPTPDQFEKLLKSAVPRPVLAAKKLLNGYLKRWEIAGKPLRPDGSCGLVDSNIRRAA